VRYGVYKVNFIRFFILAAAVFLGYIAITGNGKTNLVSASKRSLPIYSVETNEKKVSFGFNCAWDNTDIPDLIDILDQKSVKATFFVSGSWCKKYPESVKALYDAGHEIGSHSNTHADLAKLGRDEIIKEIQLCNEKIEKITGVKPRLFRMPSGSYNDLVIDTIKSQNMTPIQWDCDSIDYKNPTTEQMNKRIMDKIGNGSIMLFHSGAKNTPAALPVIIDSVKSKGYIFVTVSELIHPEPYTIDINGRQFKK
jgi:polysaccharide deacetylase family sporulation protein PdaB